MTKQEIGKAVRELRRQNGINTTKLQDRGIHPSLIAVIEKAKSGTGENYGIDTFLKYLRACGITLREVVNYKPKQNEK